MRRICHAFGRRSGYARCKIKPKEVMTLPLAQTKEQTLSLGAYKKIRYFAKGADVLAIGPGLGKDNSTYKLARRVISNIHKPMVIDADGLNALAGQTDILKTNRKSRPDTILTPHPGEMSRLCGLSMEKVQKNRKNIAKKFAKDYNVTVVLKGYRTEVCDSHGNAYTNSTGNPGMSTAGSGDVLTGMIAAFLGQGLDAFNAAKYAVYLHGLAGDLAAKEKTQISLIASDIINKIPAAIKKCN
jgi:hydroxyethylthiazole kinase-like uncharacterized protein yjeF